MSYEFQAIHVFIPTEIHKRFKLLALIKNRSYKNLLIELMEKKLKEEEKTNE